MQNCFKTFLASKENLFVLQNQWQKILPKVRKASEIAQDQKTLISAFA